jgi:hypothetical protein
LTTCTFTPDSLGLILSLAENRKPLVDLELVRVTIRGAVAAAAWPLLTHADDRMVYILCPFGAACALVSVVIARKAELLQPARLHVLTRIDNLLAKPLQAACA